MPNWSVPVLQWGGLALAIVSAAALIYVLGIMEPAAEGEQITAPVPVYWVLLAIGVAGAIPTGWSSEGKREGCANGNRSKEFA